MLASFPGLPSLVLACMGKPGNEATFSLTLMPPFCKALYKKKGYDEYVVTHKLRETTVAWTL